jgi:hypothetical protein
VNHIIPELRLARPTQVADSIGVTVGTLAKMRLSGRGPAFIRVGRRICYDVREVRRWLDQHTFRSTSEAAVAGLAETVTASGSQ